MKTICPSAYALLLTLSLACGTGALDAADSSDSVTIAKTVLVRQVGDQFEPVENFTPTDTFGVLVFLNDGKPDTRVKADWIAVDAGGMKNKSIFVKEVALTAEALKTIKDATRIDFSLAHDNPYPTGSFTTEIYLNDVLVKIVEFKIVSLTYTLDFCGTKKTENPTEADLQESVTALDTDKNDAFLALGTSETTYLQVSGDEKAGFVLEYQEDDVKHHYQAKRTDLTAAEIVKALVAYAADSEEWKKVTEWTKVEL